MLSAIEAGDLSIIGHELIERQNTILYEEYITLYEEAIKDATSRGLVRTTVNMSSNEPVEQLLREELKRSGYSVRDYLDAFQREISWGKK